MLRLAKEWLYPSNHEAKVFVWSGDNLSDVGHVSIEFPTKNHEPPVYTSIWPAKFPAVGPLCYLPLRATLSTQLSDDVRAESSGFSLELGNGDEALIPRRKINYPDKEFSVKVPHVDSMEQEFKRIQSGVKEGKICYQLFPQVKTTKTEVYNCSTLVDHLLKMGGVDNLPEKPEWRPAAFSDILENQPNVALKR